MVALDVLADGAAMHDVAESRPIEIWNARVAAGYPAL